MNLRPDNPALSEGRTIHPKTIRAPDDVPRLLIPGSSNRKIGGRVKRGPWKGMPIYTLTLEERATCPSSCPLWRGCYGNNMRFARRIDHRSRADLLVALSDELDMLDEKHPGGYVVRLHILGDFFDVGYARFWLIELETRDTLRIFGYTHRLPASESTVDRVIAAQIRAMNNYADRCVIRFSDLDPEEGMWKVANAIDSIDDRRRGFTVCPNQLDPSIKCADCALCWNRDQQIHFLKH